MARDQQYTTDFTLPDGPLSGSPYTFIGETPAMEVVSNEITTPTGLLGSIGFDTGANAYNIQMPADCYAAIDIVSWPSSPDTANNIVMLAVRNSTILQWGTHTYMDGISAVMQLTDASTAVCSLRQVDNTQTGALIELATFTFDAALPCRIWLELEGTTVTVYKNSTVIQTATATSIPNGRYAAFAANGTVMPYAVMDNFECGGIVSGTGISNVNTDNVVKSNGQIVINGYGLSDITTVTLRNNDQSSTLTISSHTADTIICDPLDVLTTQLRFDTANTTVRCNDGTTDYDQAVSWLPEEGDEYIVISGINTAYLAKDIPGAADGDQLVGPDRIGDSEVTYYADSDALYSPALPNPTIHKRKWFLESTDTWDEGDVTISQTADQAPYWTGTPTPHVALLGATYLYPLSGLVGGGTPTSYTVATGTLPAGLVVNSATGDIEGIPTEEGTFAGITVTAANSQGSADSPQFSIFTGNAQLSAPAVTNITQTSAVLSVDCGVDTGTVYFAVRLNDPYQEGDEEIIKNGAGSIWHGSITASVGRLNRNADTLQDARQHYGAMVQEANGVFSNIAFVSFFTLAYGQGPTTPTQPGPYPNLLHYRDTVVMHDLAYGWGGDAPLEFSVTGLPTGLEMDENAYVTGTPTVVGAFNTVVTCTNANGSNAGSFLWNIAQISAPPPTGWTRAELMDIIKAYSDRYDQEVHDNLPHMISLAEDRMSRIMRNYNMSGTYATPLTGADYYALPADFGGLRDIEIRNSEGRIFTPQYVNPEQANNLQNRVALGVYYYTIIGNRIHIIPRPEIGGALELVYHQRVPKLLSDSDSNWVLAYHRDIYKTAVLAEVENFVKNDDRAQGFWNQLDAMFAELAARDQEDRWSGSSLSIKTENPGYGV